MRDDVAFEAAGVVEVELLEALAGRESGGADAALAAVGLPGGDLRRRALRRSAGTDVGGEGATAPLKTVASMWGDGGGVVARTGPG